MYCASCTMPRSRIGSGLHRHDVVFAAGGNPPLPSRAGSAESERPHAGVKFEPLIMHLADLDSVPPSVPRRPRYARLVSGSPGTGYPAEQLKPELQESQAKRFEALLTAAGKLKALFGDWKVPWGTSVACSRRANFAEGALVPFDDKQSSLACPTPGPLGVVFNTYYTPITPQRRKQYGVVGHSFVGVSEFGRDQKVKASTILQFGESADPKSPHFFDQAQLYVQQKVQTCLVRLGRSRRARRGQSASRRAKFAPMRSGICGRQVTEHRARQTPVRGDFAHPLAFGSGNLPSIV